MPSAREALKQFGDQDHTLYLVDISSFIFRAFYAIRHLNNSKGIPTNAVYGVAQMISKLNDDAKPKYLGIVYDSPEPSFRLEMFEDYKANRSEPPDDLVPQFDLIEKLIQHLNIPSFREAGAEADDLIAAITKKWVSQDKKNRVVVVTGDKDLMQLVNGRVRVWDTMKDKVFADKEVIEKFGVRPDQIRDYLAIVGDTSDNIPGVPSIGPKGATALLTEFENLDGVLNAAKDGKVKGKKGEVLITYHDQAKLSARLATLEDSLKVDSSKKNLAYEFSLNSDCMKFLKEMEFHTLLDRWKKETGVEEEPDVEAGKPDQGTFESVQTERDLQRLVDQLSKAKEVCIDLETTSLNPREAEIVGFALATDKKKGMYVPVGHAGLGVKQLDRGLVFDKLKPFIENGDLKKLGQNLKFDWNVLFENGFQPKGMAADTMVASYVYDPSDRHSFDRLCQKYLDYKPMSYEDICGKGKNQIGFDQVPVDRATRYAAEDALYTYRLWDFFKEKLQKEKLWSVYSEIELPLVEVLAKMERQGVSVDLKWLEELSQKFSKEIKKIEDRIFAHAKNPVNLNSPKQLAVFLFEELKLPVQTKTKTGYSTDAKVLEALSTLHEVPRLLLEYREIAKLKGTYVDPLPGLIDKKTNKIHAGFHQTVAATGRLSSSDPNLQNIPVRTDRGQLIRKAFVPSKGNVLVSADYSQIELRILAHMSKDKDLVDSFRKDQDVHRRTASDIFKVAPEKVDDRQRGIAKAINFGLMYGKTPFGLAKELKIPQKEARAMIDRYFERYSGVKKLLDTLISDAKISGETHTLTGRRRTLPDIRSKNPMVRGSAERMAMNTPIQGTAADLMKIAMIHVDRALEESGLQAKMIVQVHDELLIDCPKSEEAKVRSILAQKMETAMELSVPLKVNSESGLNWMEL